MKFAVMMAFRKWADLFLVLLATPTAFAFRYPPTARPCRIAPCAASRAPLASIVAKEERSIPGGLSLGYGWFIVSLPVTYYGYVASSKELNALLVEELGFNRASSDAFGPFVTLLGLIYSILLGQIYGYYFDRQGIIQDALYEEVGALKLLSEITELLSDKHVPIAARRAELVSVLHAQASALLERGLSTDARMLSRSSKGCLMLLEALESGTEGADGGREVCRLARGAVQTISAARSKRISAIAAELPVVQTVAQRVITAVVLLGFVLVDLGAPRLEALLFAVTTGSFVLINVFLNDLSDPFGGSWNVDAARTELEELVAALERQRER